MYLVVVPWAIVTSIDTKSSVACYVALVILSAGAGWWLARRSPAWLRSEPMRALDMVAWSLLVLLLVAEVGVRGWLYAGGGPAWLDSSPDAVRYRLDPTRPWLGTKPNSLGFHDAEFGEPQPGVVRVAVLGDSYTVGMVPFAENYVTLVDTALGESVDLMNMGVVHTAVRQYEEVLRTVGLPLEPDVVLLGIYIGNDIVRETPRGLLSYGGSKALRAVRTFMTLASAEAPFRQRLSMGGLYVTGGDGKRLERPLMSEEEHRQREWKHLQRLFREPQDSRMRESWSDTEAAIRDLVSLCRRNGLPVLATLAPDEIQVVPSLMEQVTSHYGVDPADFDLEYPNRRLGALLDDVGVPYFDLTTALREAERSASTYHLRGAHWNREGNAAAASALRPWLRARLTELRGERITATKGPG